MLASRIWQPWAGGREALWMNFWIMFITFADRLVWTMTSPSSRLASIKNPSVLGRQILLLTGHARRRAADTPRLCRWLLDGLEDVTNAEFEKFVQATMRRAAL